MRNSDSRRWLPLVAAVAAALSVAACSDRAERPSAITTSPPTVTPPSNTAAPATGTATESVTATTSAPTAAPGAILAAADREFFTLAAGSDVLEIETGQLALDKSKNEYVRTFAQTMVDEHTKAAEGLRQAAARVGVTPSTTMTPPHVAHLERLRALSGTEFDREYAAQIAVAGHQEAVGLFERAAREAANADVRAFAEGGLPGKRQHLELGQALAKDVGVSAERLRTANAPPDLSRLSAAIPDKAGDSAAAPPPDASVTPAKK